MYACIHAPADEGFVLTNVAVRVLIVATNSLDDKERTANVVCDWVKEV
jgi:hypothetical protein